MTFLYTIIIICAWAITISNALIIHRTIPDTVTLTPHIGALFGPSLYNISAPIVVSSPPDACELNDLIGNWQGKIVVVQRGGKNGDAMHPCPFTQKVENAASLGAVGVIIGDNEVDQFGQPAEEFDVKYMAAPPGSGDDISIPSILILSVDYQQLLLNYTSCVLTSGCRMYATLNEQGLIFSPAEYGNMELNSIANNIQTLFPFILVGLTYYWFWQSLSAQRQLRSNNANNNNQNRNQNNPANNNAVPAPPPPMPPIPSAPPVPAPVSASSSSVPPPPDLHSQPPVSSSSSSSSSSATGESTSSVALTVYEPHGYETLSLPVPPHLATGDTETRRAERSDEGAYAAEDDAKEGERQRLMRASASVSDSDVFVEMSPLQSRADENQTHNTNNAPPTASESPPQQRVQFSPPLLPASVRVYYALLKLVSKLGKPMWILRIHSVFTLIHLISAIILLYFAWDESCAVENKGIISFWFARAAIGWRIAYWQTHSNSMTPLCSDVFMKNW